MTSTLPIATVDMNGTGSAPRHEEYQYLDLVREILDTGEHRPDRWESTLDAVVICADQTCQDGDRDLLHLRAPTAQVLAQSV